jgi:hypothetical protein
LQTAALPLGYAALLSRKKMERETGFEPATSTLARLHSTTELFPLARFFITAMDFDVKEKSPAGAGENEKQGIPSNGKNGSIRLVVF